MNNSTVERFEHAGYTVKIEQDSDVESPRGWDNVGTMVHWHRRYTLGDRKIDSVEQDALERGGWRLLERYLRRFKGAVGPVLKLSLLDHSGLHMWVGGGSHWSDSAGWDSGTVGFIYATKESVEEAGVDVSNIEKILEGEVETFDQYLRGDVYGYVVEDEDGERDSCWGFYGIEHVTQEAKDSAECQRKYWTEQAKQIDRIWAS